MQFIVNLQLLLQIILIVQPHLPLGLLTEASHIDNKLQLNRTSVVRHQNKSPQSSLKDHDDRNQTKVSTQNANHYRDEPTIVLSTHHQVATAANSTNATTTRGQPRLMSIQWDDDNTINELHDTGSSFTVSFKDLLVERPVLPSIKAVQSASLRSGNNRKPEMVADKKWGKLIYHGRLNDGQNETTNLVELDEGIHVKINTDNGGMRQQVSNQTDRNYAPREDAKKESRGAQSVPSSPVATMRPLVESQIVEDRQRESGNSRAYDLSHYFGTDWRPVASSSLHYSQTPAHRVSRALVDNLRPILVEGNRISNSGPSPEFSWKPIAGYNKLQMAANRRKEEQGRRQAESSPMMLTMMGDRSDQHLSGRGVDGENDPDQLQHLYQHHQSMNPPIEQPFDDDGILIMRHSTSAKFAPEAGDDEQNSKVQTLNLAYNNESMLMGDRWAPLSREHLRGTYTTIMARPSPAFRFNGTQLDSDSRLAEPAQDVEFVYAQPEMHSRSRKATLSGRNQLIFAHRYPELASTMRQDFGVYEGKAENNDQADEYWKTEARGSDYGGPTPPPTLSRSPEILVRPAGRGESSGEMESYFALSNYPLRSLSSQDETGSGGAKFVLEGPEDEYYYQFIDHDRVEHQRIEQESLEEYQPGGSSLMPRRTLANTRSKPVDHKDPKTKFNGQASANKSNRQARKVPAGHTQPTLTRPSPPSSATHPVISTPAQGSASRTIQVQSKRNPAPKTFSQPLSVFRFKPNSSSITKGAASHQNHVVQPYQSQNVLSIQDTSSIRPLGKLTRQVEGYLTLGPDPRRTTTYVTDSDEGIPPFTTILHTTLLKPATKTIVLYSDGGINRSDAGQRF